MAWRGSRNHILKTKLRNGANFFVEQGLSAIEGASKSFVAFRGLFLDYSISNGVEKERGQCIDPLAMPRVVWLQVGFVPKRTPGRKKVSDWPNRQQGRKAPQICNQV